MAFQAGAPPPRKRNDKPQRELTAANLANQRAQPFQARMPSMKGRKGFSGDDAGGVPLGKARTCIREVAGPNPSDLAAYVSPIVLLPNAIPLKTLDAFVN